MDNRVGPSFGFHGNRLEIYGVCGFGSFRGGFNFLSKFLWANPLLRKGVVEL